jgi:hypothetical protein
MAEKAGLRLLIYDRTCRVPRLPLTHVWSAGGRLYHRLGRIDRAFGAASWDEALAWLAGVETQRASPISEIQIWSHGRWGCALLQADVLDQQALRPGHPLHVRLQAVRERLLPDSLFWFRTCQTFGARAGQSFARALVDFLGCRGAGHTHIIGFWQSGLHSLRPGDVPSWPASEGIARGTAEEPVQARPSGRRAPNTITCLHGRVPQGF